jgi:hypothetical protein
VPPASDPHVQQLPPASDPHIQQPPPASDPHVQQLTREAQLAARDGHCGVVVKIGEEVQTMDRGYYERVFVSDRTIASCL